MISGRYDYSIEVARSIYAVIKDDDEAIDICQANIKRYYEEKGITPKISIKQEGGFTNYEYSGGNQNITFVTMENKPAEIILMQYEPDTEKLIKNAFNDKESFGLPVFSMSIIEEIPQVFIDLMSRELYVSLDTPEEQAFHQKMNFLDDIIVKYGGDKFEIIHS